MATQSASARTAATSVSQSLSFDWTMTLISGWTLIGLYVDGWAHNHLAHTLETFFTPWHAIMYSGLLAALVFLSITLARGLMQGRTWIQALPDGYLLSWMGAVLVGAAGTADMIWHTILGIEVSTEALLSPPHLALAVSGSLIMTGTLRAAWSRMDTHQSWGRWLPTLLSALWIMSVITFFTQFAHPVATAWASVNDQPDSNNMGWNMGVSGFVIQSVVMSGMALFLLRRWPSVPVGSLTVLITVNTALMSIMHDEYRFIIAGALAGVTGDVVLWLRRDRPGGGTLTAWLVAASVLLAFSLGYFIILRMGEGTWWSVQVWGGSIVISGIIGWLVSLLAFPPAVRAEA